MQIIQSKLLNKFTNLTHGFTTKDTGNLAFHVNDDIANVEKNHEALAKALNYNKNSLIHMKQIHSSDVHIVTIDDNYTNPTRCDALVTNKINIPLMVMVADCSPILFYDDKEKVIAVAHAGRQGAFKNIIKNTLSTMKTDFNSNIENIYVSIGPSISPCCYKVGEEIYHEAKKLGLEYSLEKNYGSYYLDVNKILNKQLLEKGIEENNIEIIDECTCCSTDTFYSYRAKAKTGRFAGLIFLS